jgi:hypothetical protein
MIIGGHQVAGISRDIADFLEFDVNFSLVNGKSIQYMSRNSASASPRQARQEQMTIHVTVKSAVRQARRGTHGLALALAHQKSAVP